MGKVRNPVTFSEYFKLKKTDLEKLGVIDVFLNADSQLFIDPLLLGGSKHKEFSKGASTTYRSHFELIIKLLKKSKNEGDAAWRGAYKQFDFPEIVGTRLGYGSGVHGAGWGPVLRSRTLATAKEVVDIGVEDPDLFVALALFEEQIGPDRISDMATNVALKEIMDFNARVYKSLKVKLSKHVVKGQQYKLPTNPFSEDNDPIILLPKDIVRRLPVVLDYSDISDAVDHNAALRNRVNKDVGGIWAGMTRKEKRKLRSAALKDKKNFQTVLDILVKVNKEPYDFNADKEGEFFWKEVAESFAAGSPLNLSRFAAKTPTPADAHGMIDEIIKHYKHLIEDKGLWRDFWIDKTQHRNEKAAQRLFFGIASAYCKANKLDITPEAPTGTGPVDFKIVGYSQPVVLVELKLSTNNVVRGYEVQLETYKVSEGTTDAFYLVIDLGRFDKVWRKKLDKAKDRMKKAGVDLSEVVVIDASYQVPASKRVKSPHAVDDDE